jgi:hypothetical protein
MTTSRPGFHGSAHSAAGVPAAAIAAVPTAAAEVAATAIPAATLVPAAAATAVAAAAVPVTGTVSAATGAVPAAAATVAAPAVVALLRGTRVTAHHVGPRPSRPGAARTTDVRTRAGSRRRTASVHNAHFRGTGTP